MTFIALPSFLSAENNCCAPSNWRRNSRRLAAAARRANYIGCHRHRPIDGGFFLATRLGADYDV
ncbi:hypothetical protein [Paraburkholderia youngii]|uniref:Uncharacterized protein n=1 Tax=Paraburkholderia youngii TaxID=2782701 RepID=A0A7Y6K1S9_9BURK|nr:hypothetical protein [Paraburkholderia youngii]NUY02019.1 hypothetical protein [Paraburkholderia youngii]